MLDSTSLNQNAAIAAVRRVDQAITRPNSGAGSGQNAPASGTALPVETPPKPELDERPELERLAESISRFVKSMDRDLNFSVHEASGHTVIQVIDGETREVIKQIPSEEFLRMSEAIANGTALLLDTEA